MKHAPRFITGPLAAMIAMFLLTFPARGAEMLPIADGIPLMPGMTIVANSLTSFETASGRIETVEAELPNGQPATRIHDFYRQALTALGWRQTRAEKAAAFMRDSETLLITISASREVRVIRFDLRPTKR